MITKNRNKVKKNKIKFNKRMKILKKYINNCQKNEFSRFFRFWKKIKLE